MQMNVNGVRNAGYLDKVNSGKGKSTEKTRDFRSDLAGNLPGQMAQNEDTVQESKTMEGIRGVSGAECYQSMMSAYALHNAERFSNAGITECKVRDLSYEECDYVKVCIEQGAVYKMQICEEKNQVYVEQKKEDGTVTGYLVDIDKIDKDTASPVEQTAIEAWEKAQTGEAADTEEAFQEALEKFYVYAEERVKNGPPKFAVGASELTIEEWDKLIESVDAEIDAAKEDLRKRTAEKEEKAEKEAINALLAERERLTEKGPYSFLMGADGTLNYNGVSFTYDQTGALCLGDMSNPDDVLTIYLSDGVFKLNRDNIDDLSKAISMFSPEDINRILRAISQDAKCKKKLNEIEDMLFNITETLD